MALKIQGQTYQLLEPGADIIIELDNSEDVSQEAQFRFTDDNQTDPAGRFRLRITGDSITVDRATKTNWTKFDTLLTVESDGATITFSEDGFIDLITQLQMELAAGGPVAILFKQLIEEALL